MSIDKRTRQQSLLGLWHNWCKIKHYYMDNNFSLIISKSIPYMYEVNMGN